MPYAKPKPCYAKATMSIPRSTPPSLLSFPSSDPAPRRNRRARTPPTKHVLGRRARGNSTLKKSRFPNCSDSSPNSPDLQTPGASVSQCLLFDPHLHFPFLHKPPIGLTSRDYLTKKGRKLHTRTPRDRLSAHRPCIIEQTVLLLLRHRLSTWTPAAHWARPRDLALGAVDRVLGREVLVGARRGGG